LFAGKASCLQTTLYLAVAPQVRLRSEVSTKEGHLEDQGHDPWHEAMRMAMGMGQVTDEIT